MYVISEIDVVEREIFEYNIFFVAFDSICFNLIVTSFDEANIRKNTDYTYNQQEN
jgi:hypothetical protein